MTKKQDTAEAKAKAAAEKADQERKAAEKLEQTRLKAEAKAQKEKEAAEKKAQREAEKAEKKAAAEKARAEAKALKEQEKQALKEAKEAERAAKKAEKEAEKVRRAAEREANRMPEQNGVRRPKAETKCGQAWSIFDKVSQKNGSPASIGESMEIAKAQGLNEANVRAEYASWRKFNGVSGRIAGPKPPQAPAATA